MRAYIEIDKKQSEGQTWYRGSSHLLNLSEEIMKKRGIPYWLFDDPEFHASIRIIVNMSVDETGYISVFTFFLNELIGDLDIIARRITLKNMVELAREDSTFRERFKSAIQRAFKEVSQ